MKKLKIYCRRCGGTGLYSGFAEPEGVAVICLGCDGSGAEERGSKSSSRASRRGASSPFAAPLDRSSPPASARGAARCPTRRSAVPGLPWAPAGSRLPASGLPVCGDLASLVVLVTARAPQP